MAVTGRPREFDRDSALEAAMYLFWKEGFTSTSMADLCEAMGIRSPSLYAAFGSKEALYLEAIEHYVKTWGPPIWNKLIESSAARDGVEAMLLAAAKTLPRSRDTPAGCMATLAAIGDELPSEIAGTVKKIRHNMLSMLRSRLQAAHDAGELQSGADPESLARFYLGVYQGMAIQARDGATAADLRAMMSAAMASWPGR